jgi:hypothetical protein
MQDRIVSIEKFGGSRLKIFGEFVHRGQVRSLTVAAESLRSGSGHDG